MIYIFRLSRLTGVNALFTIGREIKFNKLIYRGVQIDNYKPNETDSYDFEYELPVPLYADCDFLNENNIVMNNGNLTTDAAPKSFIPITGADGTTLQMEEWCLVNEPTVWAANKQVRIRIREVEVDGGVIDSPLDALFGTTLQQQSTTNYAHAGVNLVFEFIENNSHLVLDGSTAFADST